jgi:hypothetical protein
MVCASGRGLLVSIRCLSDASLQWCRCYGTSSELLITWLHVGSPTGETFAPRHATRQRQAQSVRSLTWAFQHIHLCACLQNSQGWGLTCTMTRGNAGFTSTELCASLGKSSDRFSKPTAVHRRTTISRPEGCGCRSTEKCLSCSDNDLSLSFATMSRLLDLRSGACTSCDQ